MVESAQGPAWKASKASAGLAESSGPALGAPGALEERQQAHRRCGARAQSLGDRAGQTRLGRGATALGHALSGLSQHAGAREAFATPTVSRSVVVGGGAPGQGA